MFSIFTPIAATANENDPATAAPVDAAPTPAIDDGLTADQETAVNDAQAAARTSGEPVVVDELTTPTQLFTALPDGLMQYETSTVPVRAEEDGEWKPVDTSLVKEDGWLEPAVTAAPVRFSLGGSDELTQLQLPSGEWVTERWPHGVLPAPVVEGATATYPNVLPDVDLKLTARDVGVATVFVVKTPAAAKSAALRDLGLEMEDAELEVTPQGNVTAETDAQESEAITASQPLWWDSSDGGDASNPGGINPVLPVTHELTEDGVSMDVAASVGTKKPQYPIFVDPDWVVGRTAAWYTDAAYPDASYLNVDTLRMGRFAEHRGNVFYEFDISSLYGKQIQSAQLHAWQIRWAACPNNPVQVRTFGPQAAGFTWNQQNHSLWGPVLDTINPGSCSSGPEVVAWNVTAGVQSKLGQASIQLGLAPQDENVQSRRHFEPNASLRVTYNSYPDQPINMSMTSPVRQCSTSSSNPAWLGGQNVTVQMYQTDPDPGNVDTNVYLMYLDPSTNRWGQYQHQYPGLVAQGYRSVIFTNLPEGLFKWYARGSDWVVDGKLFSDTCYFRVDNTAPAAATVTSTATSFTVGQSVTVNLSGANDVAGYEYWITPGAPTTTPPPAPVQINRQDYLPNCTQAVGGTRFACGAGATQVPITVAPVDGTSTLWVAAYDKAGNVSPSKALKLYSANGTPAQRMPGVDAGHMWQTSELLSPLPTTIPDTNPWIGSQGKSLSVPSDVVRNETSQIVPPVASPVLRFSSTASAANAVKTASSPLDLTGSFTFSVWVKPSGIAADQTIASQAGPGRGRMELRITSSKYAFCLLGDPAGDDNGRPVSGCATAPSNAASGQWTLVTGMWDAVNQQLRLIQGGTTSATAVAPHVLGSGDWSANGPLVLAPPSSGTRFAGLLANPLIVPTILDSYQMNELSFLGHPFTQ